MSVVFSDNQNRIWGAGLITSVQHIKHIRWLFNTAPQFRALLHWAISIRLIKSLQDKSTVKTNYWRYNGLNDARLTGPARISNKSACLENVFRKWVQTLLRPQTFPLKPSLCTFNIRRSNIILSQVIKFDVWLDYFCLVQLICIKWRPQKGLL